MTSRAMRAAGGVTTILALSLIVIWIARVCLRDDSRGPETVSCTHAYVDYSKLRTIKEMVLVKAPYGSVITQTYKSKEGKTVGEGRYFYNGFGQLSLDLSKVSPYEELNAETGKTDLVFRLPPVFVSGCRVCHVNEPKRDYSKTETYKKAMENAKDRNVKDDCLDWLSGIVLSDLPRNIDIAQFEQNMRMAAQNQISTYMMSAENIKRAHEQAELVLSAMFRASVDGELRFIWDKQDVN